MESKTLIILRGLPGSGKSTLARRLVSSGIIHSTDDFFVKDGNYEFDASLLEEAHAWNLQNAKRSMESGIDPVIIDNTNVRAIHMKPYVAIAAELGYAVRFVEPNSPWRFDVDELVRRNRHGVERAAIQTMLDAWDVVDSPEDVLA